MRTLEKITQGTYLFPFTAEAALMTHILKNNGISVHGIFDNDTALWGKDYCGHVIECPDSNTDIPVIICGHRHYEHCDDFVCAIKIEEVIHQHDIAPAVEMINYAAFESLAPRQKLRMHRIDYDIHQVLLPDSCLSSKEPLIINSIHLLLTSRCTLRCKDCSDLMQYYKHPKDEPLERIISSIDALFANANFIRNITILGGETLLHPELPEIVRHIAKHRDRIGIIWITTNGTLLPTPELIAAIKSCDVLLRISDYPGKSRKKDEIQTLCRAAGARVELISYGNYFWREAKRPVYPPCEDKAENARRFLSCQSRIICNSVYGGKYYFCEFLAHIEDLMGIPYDPRNSLPLDGVTKADIRAYFSDRQYPPGCAYCTGDNIHEMPSIEPAIQAPAPLPYQSFSETYGK